MADIDINEDFITRLQNRLQQINNEFANAQLGNDPSNTGSPTPSGGAIKDLTVSTGPATFPVGATFQAFVKSSASTLDTRLTNHHSLLTEFVADITDMLDNTDHIESLNSMSVADIQTYFPSTSSGSSGPPTTA